MCCSDARYSITLLLLPRLWPYAFAYPYVYVRSMPARMLCERDVRWPMAMLGWMQELVECVGRRPVSHTDSRQAGSGHRAPGFRSFGRNAVSAFGARWRLSVFKTLITA